MHGDNAPNLIAGENAAVCEELGVHVTSSAPYEPRGNSTIERPWRTWGEDIRSALAHANISQCDRVCGGTPGEMQIRRIGAIQLCEARRRDRRAQVDH